MLTPDEKKRAGETAESLKRLGTGVAGAAAVFPVAAAVFGDATKLGYSLVAVGCLGIVFWAAARWTRLGKKRSSFVETEYVDRFSRVVRDVVGGCGLAAAVAGVGILLYAHHEAKVPADVYVFDTQVVLNDGKQGVRPIFQLMCGDKQYDAMHAYEKSEEFPDEYGLEFAIAKRANHRWQIVNSVSVVVDEYAPYSTKCTSVASQTSEFLKEVMVYNVEVSPPTKSNNSFQGVLVLEDSRLKRIRLESEQPCSIRLNVRFTKPGIYTWSAFVSLTSPQGTDLVPVVKKRVLAITPPREKLPPAERQFAPGVAPTPLPR